MSERTPLFHALKSERPLRRGICEVLGKALGVVLCTEGEDVGKVVIGKGTVFKLCEDKGTLFKLCEGKGTLLELCETKAGGG